MILLWLVGQLLLRCQGIALRVEPANDCLDAVPGDSCHKLVKWALDQGLEKHPEWFPSFKRSYSEELDFKHIQGILHSHKKAGCGRPCLAEPDAASPPAAGEAAPAAPAAGEATPEATLEAALAAAFEKAAPADAPEPAAREERPPRSNLIGKLEGELEALGAMMDSPDLETLRTEKRQLIQNLRAADKLEAELKAHKLQSQQAVKKIEGELERLEGMENSPAMELLRGEKSKEIDEVRAADKSETELKTREIQRLQDPAAAAKEVAATDAPAAAAPAAAAAATEVLKPEDRTNLLGKLDAELKAMDHMKDSPAMETLRAEKRQLIQNLQAANKLEAELKAGQLRNQKTVAKMEADLKALEEMNDSPALQALRTEKRTQIQNLQEADKAEAERTVRELRRLQDPAEAAKDAAPAAPAAERAKPEAPAAGRKPWWKKWQKAKAKEEATTEEATAVVDSQSEATPEQATAPAASSREAEPAEAPAAAAGEADPEVALAPSAAEEATPLAAPAAEEAKPADAATPANAPAAAVGEEDPEVALAPPAAEEAMPLAAPAAEEAKPADAATPAKAPAAAAGEADPEVALAPPAAEEATPDAAPAAEEAKPADAATPAKAPAAAAEEPTRRAAVAASTEEAKLAAPAAQEGCRDAVPGDRCYTMVNWALEKGVKKHDQWFLGQKSDELNFKAIQDILYKKGKGGCGKPCPAATTSPAPDVQIALTDDEATSTKAPAAAMEEAKPEAAPAAEEAEPADAATPAKVPAAAAGEADPEVALAPPAAEEATPLAAPAAEEAKPADAATPAKAPAQAAEGAAPSNLILPQRAAGDLGGCMDAVAGDRCHVMVKWALEKGVAKHPDMFQSYKQTSSEEVNFKRIQEILHNREKGGCGMPCWKKKEPPSAARMQAQDCKDPVDGDKCHKFVTWALAKGPKALPDLFSNFTFSFSDEANFKHMQGILHDAGKANCTKPCPVVYTPAEEARLKREADEAQGCLDAVDGDRCHKIVTWALTKGIAVMPEYFSNFTRSESEDSDFKRMQGFLHDDGKGGCRKPCSDTVAELGVPAQREAGVTTTNFVMPVFDMPAMPAVDAEMAAAATSTLPALAPQEESPSDEQEEMPSADAEPTREAPLGEPAAQNAAQDEAEVKDPQSSAAAEAPAEEQAAAAPAAEEQAATAPAAEDEAEGKPAVAEGRPAATEAKEPERKPRSRMERAVAWQEEAEATAAARQPAKLAKLDASGEECVDAVPGDRCHETVKWTLAEGLEANPELFPSFHRSSSEEYDFKHIQAILHMRGAAGCGKPCDMVQAPTDGLEATGAEVQGATESEAQLWTYTPVNGKAITARGEPEFDGKKTGKKLSPGDTFRVVEEKKVGETTFLKLADGEGWLFDMKPEVGIMCTKVQSAAEAVDQEKEEENNENKTALEPMTSKSLSEMSPEEFQAYLGDQSELDKYAYYLSHTSRRKRWEDEAKRQNKTQSLASRRQKV